MGQPPEVSIFFRPLRGLGPLEFGGIPRFASGGRVEGRVGSDHYIYFAKFGGNYMQVENSM